MMEIIDFHTHVFPDQIAPRAVSVLRESAGVPNKLDGTLADLRRSMRRHGITRSVLLSIATKPEQVEVINSACPALISEDTIPFGTLHPRMADPAREVQRLHGLGIRGIKLHPEYQDFYVDDRAFFPAYEALRACGMILLFHAGKDPGPFSCDHALPRALRTVVREFPGLRIVAAHMGGWQVWDEVEEALAGEPLWFDTSAVADHLSMEQFVRLVRRHGAQNVLFGTDSPWYDQGEVRTWIEHSPLTDSEKERIFVESARDLLGALPASR